MRGSKDLIITENAVMRREIELLRDQLTDLKKEKIELKEQLKYTQEALIAKESPEAYNDQKYAEDMANTEPPSDKQIEQKRLQARRAEIASNYINEMENPLFKDAEDMISMLTHATGVPLAETQSLHGNDES